MSTGLKQTMEMEVMRCRGRGHTKGTQKVVGKQGWECHLFPSRRGPRHLVPQIRSQRLRPTLPRQPGRCKQLAAAALCRELYSCRKTFGFILSP